MEIYSYYTFLVSKVFGRFMFLDSINHILINFILIRKLYKERDFKELIKYSILFYIIIDLDHLLPFTARLLFHNLFYISLISIIISKFIKKFNNFYYNFLILMFHLIFDLFYGEIRPLYPIFNLKLDFLREFSLIELIRGNIKFYVASEFLFIFLNLTIILLEDGGRVKAFVRGI